jgi:ribosomal protein S18 acetylase RimI-like enzyme
VLLNVRRANAEDVPVLVDLYDRAYHGGYSASFDRYGPIKPGDFWWIQSEKEVLLLEVNHRPAGIFIIGRREGALVVEEAVGDLFHSRPGLDGASAKAEQTLLQRLGAYLLQYFRRERQERLLLRTAEANPLGLSLARHLDLAFVNALVVTALRPRRRQTARAPEGSKGRRAAPADTPEMLRIYGECFPIAPDRDELERLIRRSEVRTWVAERENYMVAFLLAEARSGGFGDLVAGVREAHRGRGVGRALAVAALNFFHARQIPALGLYWGLDGTAHAYYRSLGFSTERVYLFFEKPL